MGEGGRRRSGEPGGSEEQPLAPHPIIQLLQESKFGTHNPPETPAGGRGGDGLPKSPMTISIYFSNRTRLGTAIQHRNKAE